MTSKKVAPVSSLPRGTAHPVTDLALAYFRSLAPETMAAAADYIDEQIGEGKMAPEMGSVSETLRRVLDRQPVSDRYLNSAAFYVLYNAVAYLRQETSNENSPS